MGEAVILKKTGGGSGGGGAVILRAVGTAGNNVTARLGEKTVSGIVGDEGAVQLDLPELGLWNVTTESGAYSFEQAVKVYRYGITECWALANKPLNECTWPEIDAIARSGQYKQIWKVGDTKQIQLQDGQAVTLQLAGIDHDVDPDGNTIPLTFIMQQCFNTLQVMNQTDTNVNGWAGCTFRTATLSSLVSLFPEELRAVVTKCRKKTSIGNLSATVTTTDDDFWLPSEIEVFGTLTNSFAGEGEVYPIFTDVASRIKTCNDAVTRWWLRSPSKTQNTYFCIIERSGVAGIRTATGGSTTVALGFCVGKKGEGDV